MTVLNTVLTVCFLMTSPEPQPIGYLSQDSPKGELAHELLASSDNHIKELLAELATEHPNLSDPEVVNYLRNREILFDYFFDPAFTSYAGYKIILCSGQVIQSGVITPFFFTSYDPCGVTDL